MLSERTANILEAAIRDFIETGLPVSSGHLYKRHRLPVKPATIRNELSALEDRGFLAQLHTSGGRVPTDKGYQFLVDQIFKEWLAGGVSFIERAFAGLDEEFAHGEFKEFVHDFARELKMLGAGYVTEDHDIQESYKSGFDELMRTLEFTTRDELVKIVEDVERMDERLMSLFDGVRDPEPKVFVGKSPITRSDQLSVVAGRYRQGNENVFLVAVGSKRMNYEHVLKCFKNIGEQNNRRTIRKKHYGTAQRKSGK